jgi:hypothetical protein
LEKQDSRFDWLPILIDILSPQEAAAGALANLALHEDNKVLLSREGGIPALTELVKSGTPPAQLVGMEALKNLATHPENCEVGNFISRFRGFHLRDSGNFISRFRHWWIFCQCQSLQ